VLATTIDLPSGLVWADDTAAGIRRRRAGRGFVYLGPNGRAVSAVTRARVQALAVPPAWTDVWIALDENGHVQATGRGARRQAVPVSRGFRAREREVRAPLRLGLVLPDIRRQAATDLA
jgi:DNA topoisomerase-1